uniref:Uncharacterized protein n=1 Tax=Nothobranchius korthausae TaxID=1143690 RepID=A0A1A8FH25_9TELE
MLVSKQAAVTFSSGSVSLISPDPGSTEAILNVFNDKSKARLIQTDSLNFIITFWWRLNLNYFLIFPLRFPAFCSLYRAVPDGLLGQRKFITGFSSANNN